MFNEAKERFNFLMNQLADLPRDDDDNDLVGRVFDAETIVNIGEAALLDGADPDDVLTQLAQYARTTSVEKLADRFGFQDGM
jgi:hypothetical protein